MMAEKKSGNNVLDYLRWRGDLTLAQSPFNEVDNLVLCILSYLNYRRFPELMTRDPAQAKPIGEIASLMTPEDEQLGLSEESYLPVIHEAAKTVRFRDMCLFGYTSVRSAEQESQFQAISFLLPDESVFIAYMGTDRSMAGWKEDFNMSFLDAVPAQKMGEGYALVIGDACPRRKLRLGGHSKGGNLAMWAGLHLPEDWQTERLLAIYNNDGPGFSRSLRQSPRYARVRDRLYTFVPESSIVGVLLDHPEDYTVIESTNKAIAQHEALSWCCLGTHFIHLGQRSEWGRIYDGTLQEWIGSMTPEERREFSDALFSILTEDGKYQTVDDIRRQGKTILLRYAKADERKKKIITEIFRRLAVDIGSELRKKTEAELENAKNTLVAAGKTLLGKKE